MCNLSVRLCQTLACGLFQFIYCLCEGRLSARSITQHRVHLKDLSECITVVKTETLVFSLSGSNDPNMSSRMLETSWNIADTGFQMGSTRQISSFVKVLRRLFKFVDFLFTHRQNCLCTHSHTLAVCLYWNIWWWMLWVYISTDSSLIGLQDSITHRTNQWSPTMNASDTAWKTRSWHRAGLQRGLVRQWQQ